jgi:signal transduction histidine kinase
MMQSVETGVALEARHRRILVIDDNPAIHEDFRKIFCAQTPTVGVLLASEAALFGEAEAPHAEAGFELDSAYQGMEALELIIAASEASRPYAMAFLDVRMPPGWDGIETATRIWQQDPHLQIVFCTAYSDYSWQDIRAKLGRSDRFVILKKPFDIVEVLQLADALTEKWRVTEQVALKVGVLEQAVGERTREIMAANQALQTEIMERKLIENQLVQAQKLESIGQLAAGIAHEINTPIQYIGDSAEFLRDAMTSMDAVLVQYRGLIHTLSEDGAAGEMLARARATEEAAELDFLRSEMPRAFERVLEGVTQVAKIVRAMKEFSFPDARGHSYSNINHALETTLVVCRNEYKLLAGVETRFGELPEVKCDIGELNQAFLNLIVNAAHAIRESGKDAATGLIAIHTSVAHGVVEVAISDNGCGIAPEYAHKVFDPFFTTKEVGRGSGQGLSIARAAVVTRHGGTLDFESEVGRGTTFFVRVPVEGVTERAAS